MFLTAFLGVCVIKFSPALSDIAHRNISSDDYVPCEKGWYYFRDKCYKTEGRKSWTNALAQCQEYGADLVSIQSQEEQDFIIAFLLLGKEYVAWIGLNDHDNESDYTWTDGSVFNYTNWYTGQPKAPEEKVQTFLVNEFNRTFPISIYKIPPDYCAYMYLHPIGKWRNVPCDEYSNDYICEKKANPKNSSPNLMYCPPLEGGGWKYENSCYHIVTEAKSWQNAESYCKNNYKGHLLYIQDTQEDTFLEHALPDIEKEMWLGIQVQKTLHQKWTSGWPVSLETFNTVEKPVEGTCVARRNQKEWIKIPCSKQLPFICKVSNETAPVLKSSPIGSYCPKEFDEWRDLGGDYCYFIETKRKVNFSEARSHCRGRGGDLVSIHSQEEADMLKSFIRHTGYSIYIGLIRVKGNTGHVFEWTDDSVVDFHNWGYDEPNRIEEECVEALTGTMKWRDTLCENRLSGFICSVKKIVSSSNVVDKTSGCSSSSRVSLNTLIGVFVGILLAIILIAAAVYYFRPCGKNQHQILHNLLLRQVDQSSTDLPP